MILCYQLFSLYEAIAIIALAENVNTCIGLKNIPIKQTIADSVNADTTNNCHTDTNSILFITLLFLLFVPSGESDSQPHAFSEGFLINSDSPLRNYLPELWHNYQIYANPNILRTLHKCRKNRGLASSPR